MTQAVFSYQKLCSKFLWKLFHLDISAQPFFLVATHQSCSDYEAILTLLEDQLWYPFYI